MTPKLTEVRIVESEVDTLWRIYGSTNNLIQFADTKASYILAANGIIIGAIITNLAVVKDFLHKDLALTLLLVLGLGISGLSSYFALRCLNPTLHYGQPTSLIFFAHIVHRFDGLEAYREAAHAVFTDEAQLTDQVAEQVWITAQVATKKYVAVAWATRLLAATVLVGIGLLIGSFMLG
ncbi:MAG TPA: Pycsar system effector family protein [Chloroflexia bacterium]|nr:Pycsar system effector family protein [Chloroflexia bacterium]